MWRVVFVRQRHLHALSVRVISGNMMQDDNRTIFRTADLEEALASGDEDAVHAALHDLLLYKAVHPLAPADLDAVAAVLDLRGKAAQTGLQILYASAMRQGTLPADRGAAATRLRVVLECSGDDRTAVRLALHLLAVLGDDQAVIEHLAADGDSVRKEDYLSPVMAAALTRHDADLAALQAALTGRAADEIRAVREYARDPDAYEERVRLMQEDEVEML
ncbi:hypothetical protein RJ40_01910 [Methanofollis aquaemaris]|uniref:HEAT repeat domain-containing protein n=1 Tax=Methanofollis aquaemaris TaxID=126734 RepID=A0A8A3S3V4_9EURY|nr:hypothetical protein [Methanofollis aquaemaris]QSZ66340.1 hypothetical protein RJ40_01910 [Methanofollis aquaemaris]